MKSKPDKLKRGQIWSFNHIIDGPRVYRVISDPFLKGFGQIYTTYRVRLLCIDDEGIWYDEKPGDLIKDTGWSFIAYGVKCVLCESDVGAENDYICSRCLANRHS